MKEGALTQSMRLLANLLETRTGQVLSENRLWRLETSLRPIVRAHGMTTLDELVASVMSNLNGPLADAAVNALLNNETGFSGIPIFSGCSPRNYCLHLSPTLKGVGRNAW